MKEKSYFLLSLGCPKNLVDSEGIAFLAEQAGLRQVSEPAAADMVIINTCGFIRDAKEESIDAIMEAVDLKNQSVISKLIVTGCLVKRYHTELSREIPEIDEIIDLKDFNRFQSIFALPACSGRKLLTPSHYAYLRISDGCNNHCSYCAIPAIRGNLRSLPLDELITEARQLAAGGVKELILTAQDITRYGEDLYGKSKLPELLRALQEIPELAWIRTMYLHPASISDELLDAIAGLDKVCHYLDIPIQHINDTILASMNRRTSRQKITELLQRIRSRMTDAAIRTTLIVGYPGETRQNFLELKDFIREQRFLRLGVFAYSPEEGTPAFTFTPLPSPRTAQRRRDEILQLQQEISSELLNSLHGSRIKVIIDQMSEYEEFRLEGRAYFDAPEIDGTVFISSGTAQPGEVVTVEITDSWEYDLIGKIVE
ncbi:MAG: 30S ribosomal protein S12 methylthiotransferase RimO [Candidatus Cloacimonetes bacterium]|nr:30S ribosomal protein S12 methylthiotransferase RimO [Candidatus Cloacimonadota bacterium]